MTDNDMSRNIEERLKKVEHEVGLIPQRENPLGTGLAEPFGLLRSRFDHLDAEFREWKISLTTINNQLLDINRRLLKCEAKNDRF